MSNYNLSFKSSAAKEFRKLSPPVKQRIADAIERLIVNPRDSGVVKLKGDDNL
jgi:mRNA-degrading endonuclease RelE of RelBE toxin-antitoxin system